MWEKLKGIGFGVLAIGVLIGSVVLAALFLHGAASVGEVIMPWLVWASAITLSVCVLILLPLSLLRASRPFAGSGFAIASLVFGVTLWVFALLITYDSWGVVGILIGLAFLGVGVVPLAMLASLLNGMWLILGELVLLTVITFGCRGLGLVILSKADSKAGES